MEVTDVPFKYGLGMQKYHENCASCHGRWGMGTDEGPPLVHDCYKPSHHGYRSFFEASLYGTRQHHWQFGDMAPVPGVTEKDVRPIIPFVRWLQKEAGIE